jgi:SAM-dependent methyltransferase
MRVVTRVVRRAGREREGVVLFPPGQLRDRNARAPLTTVFAGGGPHLRHDDMPAFRDRFAFAAGDYAAYRPHYPGALFDWLRLCAPSARRVWDCGTGSGQAATALAGRFEQVVATDPSVTQLMHAERAGATHYVASTAEAAALRSGSVDLVTVAQALHWFDREAFFNEVRRVLAPGGLLAVWSYGIPTIEPAVDEVLRRFHDVELGAYWSPERRLVEQGYAGIAFPFKEEPVPTFSMRATWTLPQLGGYVSTWSAVGKYRQVTGADPIPAVMRALADRWGDPANTRVVEWPLTLRVGSPH